MSVLDRPCAVCADGRHGDCASVTCGCLADHPGDESLMRGFKRVKRELHPEREAWVRGGWGAGPAARSDTVTVTIGRDAS